MRRFRTRSYEYKAAADYFADPNPITSAEDAAEAVAKRFAAGFTLLVPLPEA
nr:hypothetical protein [uncultured Rhodopila sp.]